MAIKEQDKVFYEVADNGDKVINLPVTRANNVEGLGRSASTAYVVGDVVYVDNNKKVALKCTNAGTTSNTELDISGKNIGDTVSDGSVVWQVCNRTSDVTSVNGKTGDVVVDTLPVGTSIMYMGNTVPDGYLAENGAAISRTTYAKLFAVIGTEYGAGDGSTTFNLPNKNNGSFAEGSNTAGTVKSAGLPNVSGKLYITAGFMSNGDSIGVITGTEGAFYNAGNWGRKIVNSYLDANYFGGSNSEFDASRCSPVYRNDITTVQPKSVTVKFCIKY